MLKIKVEDDYNLYKKHTFEFNEGITCLIGKNGAGKSTLLREMQHTLGPENVFYYTNEESEKFANQSMMFRGNIQDLVRNISGSEGQNIRYNFEDNITSMGAYVKKCKENKREYAIFLLDGLDSGISLDYIIKLKNDLFSLILEDTKKDNLPCYIIIAANNYEFCNGEDCIRVSDAKHFRFKDYEDFRKIYV